MTDKKLLKLALKTLELNNAEWKALADSGDAGYWRAEDTYHYKQTEEAITAIKEALAQPEQEPVAWAAPKKEQIHIGWVARDSRGKLHLLTELQIDSSPKKYERLHKLYTHTQPAAQPAPVQEPYAYEYGRDNGDGTYSVVIDKGSLAQTQPAVYNYVRPQNAHKDWPIKELFDRPPAQPAQRKPLTEDQRTAIIKKWCNSSFTAFRLIDLVEAAHGIKE